MLIVKQKLKVQKLAHTTFKLIAAAPARAGRQQAAGSQVRALAQRAQALYQAEAAAVQAVWGPGQSDHRGRSVEGRGRQAVAAARRVGADQSSGYDSYVVLLYLRFEEG